MAANAWKARDRCRRLSEGGQARPVPEMPALLLSTEMAKHRQRLTGGIIRMGSQQRTAIVMPAIARPDHAIGHCDALTVCLNGS